VNGGTTGAATGADLARLGCALVVLEHHDGPRGRLTVLVGGGGAGFVPQRGFVLSDVPPDADRGGHGHRLAHQLVVAVAGGVRATLTDGEAVVELALVAGGPALAVPPLVWLTLDRFTPDASVVVLGSEPYDPAELVGSLEELRALRAAGPRR
jgi:UDP-2-acetamido-3-amino-2,3-dideoxy-glucuronate N-acetyltransferase